jgi:hypothetical protein
MTSVPQTSTARIDYEIRYKNLSLYYHGKICRFRTFPISTAETSIHISHFFVCFSSKSLITASLLSRRNFANDSVTLNQILSHVYVQLCCSHLDVSGIIYTQYLLMMCQLTSKMEYQNAERLLQGNFRPIYFTDNRDFVAMT